MSASETLDLRPGDWVEVRSQAEILATLDSDGALEGLPLMPEMLAYCGQRWRVYRRADRACDAASAESGFFRHFARTVHLSMARCDGAAHGGCQAGCLMFWKEDWLRRVDGAGVPEPKTNGKSVVPADGVLHDREWLESKTTAGLTAEGQTRYRCQATDLHKASCPVAWWKPAQYVKDVRLNKIPIGTVLFTIAIVGINRVAKIFKKGPYPSCFGKLKRTPVETLDLQPGEWVTIKSKEEILATLDTEGRNRGLRVESEMLPYCGKKYRVLRRVEQIIDEPTGRLNKLGVSVILEDVICASAYRRACSRANLLYWREIWLRRCEPDQEAIQPSCNQAEPVTAAQS